ncbi:hypothetical protein ACQP3C_28200, partial [Escherichia coli]
SKGLDLSEPVCYLVELNSLSVLCMLHLMNSTLAYANRETLDQTTNQRNNPFESVRILRSVTEN